MMKKVFLYSYTELNLGDDLFIKIICDRYYEHKFYILSDFRYIKAFKKIKNLIVIPLIPKLAGLLNKINFNFFFNHELAALISKRCDVVVNIGGSIFIQSKDINKEIVLYKKRIIKNKPYFIIGSNFGPYCNENYLLEYKKIFSKVNDVCFREKYSYELFSDLNNVRYESDIVFSLKLPLINKKKQVTISVIDLSFRETLKQYEKAYINKLAKICNQFVNSGYDVFLMSFCEKEGDMLAINKILSILDKRIRNNIKIHNYKGNLNKSILIINESRYIIATRFHAMILGWISNSVVYPLIYSNKSLNVIADLKFQGDYLLIENVEELSSRKILDYFESSKSISITKQNISANKQFYYLDKFMKEKVVYIMKEKNKRKFLRDYKKGNLSLEGLEKLYEKYNILESSILQEIKKNNKNYDKKIEIENISSKKISIIIPTYNRLNQLLECLKGILIQTYNNIELIIVDDSSDNITQNYFEKNKDKRIKYYKNDKNLGVGLNRQKGYNLSTGDYIIFMDDDDYFIDKNYFATVIKEFEDREVSAVCADSYSHYEKENIYLFKKLNIINGMSTIKYLENFQTVYNKPSSSFPITFRKTILDKANFKDMKMMNDTSLYLRAFMVGGKVSYIDKIIGVYRIHNKNITFNVKADFTIKNFEEKEYIYNYIVKEGLIKKPQKWYEKQIAITARYFLNGKEKNKKEISKVLHWVRDNVSSKLYIKLKINCYYLRIKNILK